MTYLVAAFYKFAQLDNLESLRQKLLKNAEMGGLQGTLLLAAEGINATLCGSEISIKDFIDFLQKEEAFNELEVKYSWSTKKCFHRLKIRIKSEIVTIGIPEVNPQQQVGNYVQPQCWDDLIKQPNTLVIDTRNNYEIAVGSFPGAIDPGLDNFRGFPAWVEQELKPLMKKHKAERLALFCTGGIRCEKATALLVAQGFSDVHHLEGGILKYLEQIPAERSSWQGDCFVFDQRVALNHQLAPSEYSLCYACGMPLAAADRALSSYVAGVSCRHCKENFSEADRQRFAERQQQMQLANLLAIRDNSKQHQKPVRYFRRLGFKAHRELAASPFDLPLRLVW
ncbi:MAG: rhodanese-related sulfurtransferase, partial [Synechococcaceae bacterium WB8_1B_057]|nr:rhodanese-related sulfurtransferase [Synechococcaceae bacterium WB8_1B_057]